MKQSLSIVCLMISASWVLAQLPASISLSTDGVGSETSLLYSNRLVFGSYSAYWNELNVNTVLEIKRGKDAGWSESVTFNRQGDVISCAGGAVVGGQAVFDSGLVAGIAAGSSWASSPTFQIEHCKKTTQHHFQMYSINSANGQYSPYSNDQAVQFDNTADTTRPTITTLPVASLITTNSATISWGVGETGLTNSVEYWLGSGARSTVAASSTTTPSVSLTGLTVAGVYNYIVRSLDQAGNYSQASSNFMTTTSSASTGSYIVQRGFGGTAYQANCHPVALAEDSAGNVTMCGNFQLTVNFGGGDLIATPSASQGGDIFVANYSSVLAHNWSKRIGGDLEDGANSVAVDSANNVLVIGHYKGTVDFGGVTLTNAGGSDIFVAKFNGTNGALIWAKRFGGTGTDIGRALVLDSANNILITGTYGFYGSGVDFGGGVLPLAGATDTQVFVAKLNSSGGYAWANGYGGTGLDQPNAIAVNTVDDVVVIGDYQLTMNLGGTNMTSVGARDVFIAKYNGDNGAHLWSRSGGGTNEDYGKAVSFDPSGNVVVNGAFKNTNANFGGSNLVSVNGLAGIFVAKYSSAGAHTWSRGFSSTSPVGNVSPQGLAVDSVGNIVVTGGVAGNAIFDGIYIGYGTPSVMLVKFNSSGTTTWAHFYDGEQYDFGMAVRIGASDRILVTGSFSTGINFGGGLMQSPGGFDGFIAKFTP